MKVSKLLAFTALVALMTFAQQANAECTLDKIGLTTAQKYSPTSGGDGDDSVLYMSTASKGGRAVRTNTDGWEVRVADFLNSAGCQIKNVGFTTAQKYSSTTKGDGDDLVLYLSTTHGNTAVNTTTQGWEARIMNFLQKT